MPAAPIPHSAPGPSANDAHLRPSPRLFIALLTPQEDTVQADCWWLLLFLSHHFFTYQKTLELVGTSKVLSARLPRPPGRPVGELGSPAKRWGSQTLL